jgi:hypothetical protein
MTHNLARAVTLDYTNHRGERALRHVIPDYLWWGTTDWHPQEGWLLHAFDLDKNAERDFAWSGIHCLDQREALARDTPIESAPNDEDRIGSLGFELHGYTSDDGLFKKSPTAPIGGPPRTWTAVYLPRRAQSDGAKL